MVSPESEPREDPGSLRLTRMRRDARHRETEDLAHTIGLYGHQPDRTAVLSELGNGIPLIGQRTQGYRSYSHIMNAMETR
jgi:hypothetical protein